MSDLAHEIARVDDDLMVLRARIDLWEHRWVRLLPLVTGAAALFGSVLGDVIAAVLVR